MSSYVSEQLRDDETVIYEATVHWAVYILPAIFLVYGLPMALQTTSYSLALAPAMGTVISIAGFFLLVSAVIERRTTELAITSKRVIAKFGLISRKTSEQQLDRVEGVNLNQSILGRLLNYGTLTIRGTGGGITPIPKIENPGAFQEELSKMLSALDR